MLHFFCSVLLQCVAEVCCIVLQCAALCCSVLQCVAVRCSVLQCAEVCCIALQCVAVLQCAALRCSVLQCVCEKANATSPDADCEVTTLFLLCVVRFQRRFETTHFLFKVFPPDTLMQLYTTGWILHIVMYFPPDTLIQVYTTGWLLYIVIYFHPDTLTQVCTMWRNILARILRFQAFFSCLFQVFAPLDTVTQICIRPSVEHFQLRCQPSFFLNFDFDTVM